MGIRPAFNFDLFIFIGGDIDLLTYPNEMTSYLLPRDLRAVRT